MNNHTITMHRPDLYHIELWVNEERIASFTQETIRWQGIHAIEDTVKALSTKLNINLIETSNEEYL